MGTDPSEEFLRRLNMRGRGELRKSYQAGKNCQPRSWNLEKKNNWGGRSEKKMRRRRGGVRKAGCRAHNIRIKINTAGSGPKSQSETKTASKGGYLVRGFRGGRKKNKLCQAISREVGGKMIFRLRARPLGGLFYGGGGKEMLENGGLKRSQRK